MEPVPPHASPRARPRMRTSVRAPVRAGIRPPVRRLIAVLLLPLLLVAAACQPARKDPSTVRKILVVGDSITHGAFAAPGIKHHLGAYYPNAEIVYLGGPATSIMNGYDPTKRWTDYGAELNHWLSRGFDADIVVIQGCCNGFTDANRWRDALEIAIRRAREHDPGLDRRVIVATTPRIVPGTSPYFEAAGTDDEIVGSNAIVRGLSGVAIADIDFAFTVGWRPALDLPGVGRVRYIDGFHLSDAGSNHAARVISLS